MNTNHLREAVFVSVCNDDGEGPVVSVTTLVQRSDERTVQILHQHMGWDEPEVKDSVVNDSAVEGHDMFFGSFQNMDRDDDNGLNLLYTDGPEPDAAGFRRRMVERLFGNVPDGSGLPGDGNTTLMEALKQALKQSIPEQRESEDNVVPIGTGYGMYL